MKWCCSVFKSWYENAESRGFAVLVENGYFDQPEFIIQYRSTEDADVDKLPVMNFPVTLVSQIYIDYCLWCEKK